MQLVTGGNRIWIKAGLAPKHMLLTTSQLSDNIMPPICCLRDCYNGDTILEANYLKHLQNSSQASSSVLFHPKVLFFFFIQELRIIENIIRLIDYKMGTAHLFYDNVFTDLVVLLIKVILTVLKKHKLCGLHWLSNYLSSSAMEPRDLHVHRNLAR